MYKDLKDLIDTPFKYLLNPYKCFKYWKDITACDPLILDSCLGDVLKNDLKIAIRVLDLCKENKRFEEYIRKSLISLKSDDGKKEGYKSDIIGSYLVASKRRFKEIERYFLLDLGMMTNASTGFDYFNRFNKDFEEVDREEYIKVLLNKNYSISCMRTLSDNGVRSPVMEEYINNFLVDLNSGVCELSDNHIYLMLEPICEYTFKSKKGIRNKLVEDLALFPNSPKLKYKYIEEEKRKDFASKYISGLNREEIGECEHDSILDKFIKLHISKSNPIYELFKSMGATPINDDGGVGDCDLSLQYFSENISQEIRDIFLKKYTETIIECSNNHSYYSLEQLVDKFINSGFLKYSKNRWKSMEPYIMKNQRLRDRYLSQIKNK